MRKNFGAKPWTYPQPVFILATYGEDGTPDALQMPPNKNFLKLFLKRPRQIPKTMLYCA